MTQRIEKMERIDPYCLGTFTAPRSDAVYCCSACRKLAYDALHRESYAHVDPASTRRESSSDARRAATGNGWMSRREHVEADLRVRVLFGGDPIEIRAQWEALVQLPGVESMIAPEVWAAAVARFALPVLEAT